MARTRATLHISIWSPDSDFRFLTGSAQRLYFLILTQGDLSLCGVAALAVDRWARLASDTTPRSIKKSLAELVEHRYVVVDDATQELMVRTFSAYDGVLRQPNMVVSMSKDFDAIQSKPLREGFVEGLPEGLLEGLPEGYRERLSKPFVEGMLRTRVRAVSPSPSPSPMVHPFPPQTPTKSPHKTLAPERFEITDHLRDWAAKNDFGSVNLETETQKFLDHHAAKGSRFADWNRAWQTWIRTGDGWAKERRQTNETNNTYNAESVAKGADPMFASEEERLAFYGEPIDLDG